MITSEGGTLVIGDVTVTMKREIKPKIEGLIQMPPGAIHALIEFHINPGPHVSGTFIGILFAHKLIELMPDSSNLLETRGLNELLDSSAHWKLSAKGKAYIDFITGK